MAGMTAKRLDEILGQDDYPGMAVETGTFQGDTTRLLAERFAIVHTIELSPEHWRRALHSGWPGTGDVYAHLGDSASLVPLLAGYFTNRPIFWYLDAHFTPGDRGTWKLPMAGRDRFPLWAELQSLAKRDQPDVIVVDDVHAFGRSGEWAGVNEGSILREFGPRVARSAVIGDHFVIWMKPTKESKACPHHSSAFA